MKSQNTPDPKDPKQPGTNEPEKEQGEKEKLPNPSKPDNDPDQTPERETDKPPVAEPGKDRPDEGKIGFSNNYLLF